MRVLFITQGALGDHDRGRVAEVVTRYTRDPDVEELYFGFTEETTPGASYALLCAAQARPVIEFGRAEGPLITSVVPHRLDSLRAEARHAIEKGDQLVELALGEGSYGYNRYTSYAPELVRDVGQVVVFWDGSFTREPWDTVRRLRVLGHCFGTPTVIPGVNYDNVPVNLVMAPVAYELEDLRGPTPIVREAPHTDEKEEPKKKRKGGK